MTIGIAAICNQGRNIICATDGMLSAEVSVDLSTFKMQWLGEWLFLYSGTLSNADLIMEEVRQEAFRDPQILSRERIQPLLRRAYKKRFAQWAADRNLAPYDLEMDEFKKNGQAIFGDKTFAEIDYALRQDAQNFTEYVLVTGWGKTEQSAMIYGVSQDGAFSAAYDGFATIGCGENVARNMLMMLGCARHLPFEYALYAVAAAKFAAESCAGVGPSTAIAVTHKRKGKDDVSYSFVQPEQQAELRALWEKHTKPRVPEEAFGTLCKISQEIIGSASPTAVLAAVLHSMQSGSRK